MPAEVFGPDYAFLPRTEILSFEEIVRAVKVFLHLGTQKVRITGGEPLLRRDLPDLIAQLSALAVPDLALTTNGLLLARLAQPLRDAGLQRVTVSLDALSDPVFGLMNGRGTGVAKVLQGIEEALAVGLPVKINTVVQRGVNEGEIVPLAQYCRERHISLRLIEFMDVGNHNEWNLSQVYPAKQMIADLKEVYGPLIALPARQPGETALRYQYGDGRGELGIIASVTQPFCRGCNRIRLSARGELFTCLFAQKGHDLRQVLRQVGSGDELVEQFIKEIWQSRRDRYSEQRGEDAASRSKVEMSYIGG